jgi:hypothetical protein
MDKSKWFETPELYTLVKTSQRTGIFEPQVTHNIKLYKPVEVGDHMHGHDEARDKDFITTEIKEVTQQGQTTVVETKNSTYRLVARQ